jgi:mono/diheme cytochrome c family protein
VAHGALAQPSSDDNGHHLVLRDCAMCHAVEQTGASQHPAAPAFRDLNLRYPLNSLAGALAEGIIIGHPRMPQYHFSPDEIADIVRYLKSIQSHQPA